MSPTRRVLNLLSTRVSCTLLVHVALDVILLTYSWHFYKLCLLAVVALPMSQNSLVAIWASTHTSPSYLRCVGLSLGVVTTWYVASAVLPNAMASDRGAAWSIGFVVQALVIVAAFAVGRLAASLRSRTRGGPSPLTQRFSLATLLLWVSALSVPLVLMRLIIDRLGWTADVFQWQYFWHLPVIGTFNALYAIVVWRCMARRRLRALRIAGGWGLTLALGVSQVYLLRLVAPVAGRIQVDEALVLALVQAAVLCVTLSAIPASASTPPAG